MAGKKYRAAKEQIGNKVYSVEEAIALAIKTSFTKFKGTLNVAFKLNLDPKQADQQIRSSIVLPHGTGKDKTVLVITKGPNVKAAKDAGAEFVGGEELLEKIKTES